MLEDVAQSNLFVGDKFWQPHSARGVFILVWMDTTAFNSLFHAIHLLDDLGENEPHPVPPFLARSQLCAYLLEHWILCVDKALQVVRIIHSVLYPRLHQV